MTLSVFGDGQEKHVVNWEMANQFASLVGNQNPIWALFPPTPNRPCFHYPSVCDGIPKPEIERDLRRNPDLSLGMVINLPKPKPDDWRPKKGERTWGASNKHISHANCIWVEGDGSLSPEEQFSVITDAFEPLPSYVLLTGGKSVHAYWRLTEPITPEKFKNLMQRLPVQLNKHNPAYGADMGLHNPSRLMRVPGGLHPSGKRCHLVSASSIKYSANLLEDHLEPNPRAVKNKKQKGLFKNGPIADEGWFSRMSSEDQHRFVVEMVSCLPKRNETGKGQYNPNIKALAGLIKHFGDSKTAHICEEANWFGTYWKPLDEIPTIHDPKAGIGSVIELARKYGWNGDKHFERKEQQLPMLQSLFPPDLVEALKTVTKYLPYPEPLIASTYLAGISGLLKLGTSINLYPLTDFVVPLNLYMATVGKTGTKKTPLQKLLINSTFEKVLEPIREQYRIKIQAWKNKPKKEKGPKPIRPCLIINDYTPEALEQRLEIHEQEQRGLLLVKDELAGVFKSIDAYKTGGRGSGHEQLLELYDGGGFNSIRTDEKNSRSCEKSHFSIYGGIQPQVLAELQKGQDHNGQWARFLFMELPACPTELPPGMPANEKHNLLKAKGKLKDYAKKISELPSWTLLLSAEAEDCFCKYEKDQQIEAFNAKHPSHAAISNKSPGKVGRIGGLCHLLHLCGRAQTPEDCGVVQRNTLKAAIALVDYSDCFAIRHQSQSTKSKLSRCMKRFYDIASKAKKPMAWSEIWKGLAGNERDAYLQLKDEALKNLIELGFLEQAEPGPKGGKKYKKGLDWIDED